jgi:hypothetical protein
LAVPLRLGPWPESPFIVLNLLSFGALGLLAWIIARRVPKVPAWFVFAFLLSLPWTLNFSTHVVNPSYVLVGSIAFFVGFLESVPGLRRDMLPRGVSFALMGFGWLWVAQLHLSWVLLPPYILFALALELRRGVWAFAGSVLAVALGALPMAVLLAPTLYTYGLGGTERNIALHLMRPAKVVTILVQFLSFGCYELNRFLGLSMARRIVLFLDNPWLVPPALVVGLVGLLQPLILVVLWFRRLPFPDWKGVRLLALLTVIWIELSFCLASHDPQAHAFYLTFPVSALFGFYGWASLAQYRLWRTLGVVVIAASLLLHGGLAIGRPVSISLYGKRSLVAAAVSERNHRLLGERRDAAVDPGEAFRAADPRTEIEIVDSRWERVFLGKVSLFRITLRNRGERAAFVDLRYVVHYWDGDDRPLKDAKGTIKQILEPGETRFFDKVVIGMTPRAATRAVLEIVDAERVVPRSRGDSRNGASPNRTASE